MLLRYHDATLLRYFVYAATLPVSAVVSLPRALLTPMPLRMPRRCYAQLHVIR